MAHQPPMCGQRQESHTNFGIDVWRIVSQRYFIIQRSSGSECVLNICGDVGNRHRVGAGLPAIVQTDCTAITVVITAALLGGGLGPDVQVTG